MKKNFLFLIMLMIIPFVVTAGGQTEDEAAASTGVAAVKGVVEYFDGEVSVDNIPAEFGMTVNYGAVVKTGLESYCEVVFDQKNIFRVMESTIAVIRISPDSPEIEIEKGAIAALFNKLGTLTGHEPFRVKTQTAVAGVRGTAFFIKVIDPTTTYVCLCNGELELAEDDDSNPDDYSSGHHTAVYFREKDGVTDVSAAPMLYHSDEDMDRLAEHIGADINWYY